ncbi:MAG: prolipoprotein diacylglyceryl transferase [Bacteroidaceae bacterium]|nr:prolipoprotein diacylglyceryl transferase [Bacteroidaceae bacterium]
MFNLLSVVWNPELELFRLFGRLPVRYYSLMWCIGLVAAYFLVRKFFKDRKISDDTFEPLFVYCFLGILIGARLGHCIFYQPDYYLSSFEHIIEMLLPIAFTPDGVKMVGYAGLASHGGTIGIFVAIYLYCRKYKVKLLEVVDMICVATPFTAGCIRIGNLMNSEIVGKATGTDWGFIFAALGEDFPRHPAQLYEAIAYFTIFIISILIYKKHKDMVGSGFYFGFCLATIFTFRFFVEFCKEVQVDFEEGMALDMGQILSIPFMLIGAYFIYRGIKLKIKAKK